MILFQLFVAIETALETVSLEPIQEAISGSAADFGFPGLTLTRGKGVWESQFESQYTISIVAQPGDAHKVLALAAVLARRFGETCVLVTQTELADAVLVYPDNKGYYTTELNGDTRSQEEPPATVLSRILGDVE